MKRFIAAIAVVLMTIFSVAPATAAKPFAGSYKVTLAPDPSPNAFSLAGQKACKNVLPAAVDKRDLKVPTAGRLTVKLSTNDVTGHGDWDLFVLQDGEILAESTTETGNEETSVKFKRKATVTIAVCNLNGGPEGTVSYKLTK